jgi:hypothetical protein
MHAIINEFENFKQQYENAVPPLPADNFIKELRDDFGNETAYHSTASTQPDMDVKQIVQTSILELQQQIQLELQQDLHQHLTKLRKHLADVALEVENRLQSFAEQLENRPPDIFKPVIAPVIESVPIKAQPAPAVLLTETNDYETVPKEAIATFMQLYRKHSQAIKDFIDNQKAKNTRYENQFRLHEDENEKLAKSINRKIEKNFLISLLINGIMFIVMMLHFIFG